MSTLVENIKINTDWIIGCFATDQITLDYSIDSIILIDKFFAEETRRGKAIPGGRLENNLGAILFSMGAYVGETIIKNVPEDGIYPWGHHHTKDYLHQPFNQSYWEIHKLADDNELKYS